MPATGDEVLSHAIHKPCVRHLATILLSLGIAALSPSRALAQKGGTGSRDLVQFSAHEFDALYAELLEEDETVTTPINQAIEGIPEIAAVATEIDSLMKGPKKDEKRAKEIGEALLQKYPAAEFAFDTKPETDPAKIRARLSKKLEEISAASVARCFDVGQHTFSDSKPCRGRLHASCVFCGSDGKGNVVVGVIDENLQVKEAPFVSVEQLKRDFPVAYYVTSADPRVWKLASLAGAEIESEWPLDYPHNPKGAAGLPLVGLGSWPEQCFLDVGIDATRQLVSAIEDRFPDWANSKISRTAKNWRKNLDNRENACFKYVQRFCEHTYVVSNQVILAYPTKGGKVREVTAEDIDDDAKKWAEVGMTRADQLNHLQLKEQILTCKAAYDHDFRWAYKEPSTKGVKTDGSTPKPKPTKK